MADLKTTWQDVWHDAVHDFVRMCARWEDEGKKECIVQG